MSYRLATIDMELKSGGCCALCAPFHVELGPIYHNMTWAKAYLRTKWHLDPSSRLATTDMGRKSVAVPLFWGLGPHLTLCRLGRGLPPCQVSS